MPPQCKNNSRVAARAIGATPIATPVSPIPVAAPVAPVPVAPTSAVAPVAAAVNATILRNPRRHHQLPLRFRQDDGDKGEFFNLENVSGDEEDEVVVSPAPTVRPAASHSPLQTTMNTVKVQRYSEARTMLLTVSIIVVRSRVA
ncbi:uncharacterized protein F5147DRAFT_773008 [Suillus discolor]|uniref:Uncharacterized protein n=1 Tax=Suillus discolor TaxID=1912936 RepID=A0A9P7F7K7_9AGAM|nr:uncharacterized protein F5147DRAFT_773008 [Suillus discolor]KAG2109724.1 hypothetical protein F5147DRAFT_773008 [Suillus discolor]